MDLVEYNLILRRRSIQSIDIPDCYRYQELTLFGCSITGDHTWLAVPPVPMQRTGASLDGGLLTTHHLKHLVVME